MRRSTVSNWFIRLHRPVSFRGANPNSTESIRPDRTPAWEDLHLEACKWSYGQILDLRLSCRGLSTARCMVARKGIYLVEPTGPVWARKLLEEAVEEWCELDSEMN
jgi:hypothetical protein